MLDATTYVLKGYGEIDPVWVRDCFQLFKSESVNIRKLLLLKNGNPAVYSMLEIHFTLPECPPVDGGDGSPPLFVSHLRATMGLQQWTEQSIQVQ